ncbi:AraC family transcriptional regulator [Citricoccus nitrophenolicus]
MQATGKVTTPTAPTAGPVTDLTSRLDSLGMPYPRELASIPGALPSQTVSIDTSDPDQAMSVGGDVYHPHRIRLDARTRTFRMGLKALHVPDLTLGLLEYGQHLQVHTPPLQDSYQINFTAFGSVTMGYGGRAVQTNQRRAAIHGFTEETTMEGWAQPARVVGLKIPRAVLDREFELLTSTPPSSPIQFEGDFDLDSPGGRAWRSSVQSLAQGLAQGLAPGSAATPHPLLTAPLAQAVIRGLLLAAPHNHSGLLDPAPAPGPPAPIADALEFLRANAGRPLSVAEAAVAAGVSVRTLQVGFRQHLGTTPVAELRRIRLEGARQELAAGRPGTTVADVARRWGFHHAGRFAIHFAQAYGDSPSRVLARSR